MDILPSQGCAKRSGGLAVLVLAASLLLQPGCQGGRASRESDLDWLARQLPSRHPNLFFQLPEEQYRKLIDTLRGRVNLLNDAEYYVALAGIVAAIGDDHTTIKPSATMQESYGSYPIGLYFFPDGLYVTRADESIKELVGSRLVSVEGIPVDQLVTGVASMIPKLNDSLLLFRVPVLLVRPEVLYGLGVTHKPEQANFVFLGPDGKETKLQLKAMKPWAISWSEGSWTAPMWYRQSKNLWHMYLTEHETLYIQYNASQGDLALGTAEIVSVLNSRPVKRVIFDMRRNAGGDPRIAQQLIATLATRPEVKLPGHLFVIVGRRTYSSTIPNCYDFLRQTNAIFFGEPTGGRPGGFGLTQTAKLPYSNLEVEYSTTQFPTAADGFLQSFVPTKEVYQTAADFAVGRDTVLEAILRYGRPD